MAASQDTDWMDPYLLDEDEDPTTRPSTQAAQHTPVATRPNTQARDPPFQIPRNVVSQLDLFEDARSVSDLDSAVEVPASRSSRTVQIASRSTNYQTLTTSQPTRSMNQTNQAAREPRQSINQPAQTVNRPSPAAAIPQPAMNDSRLIIAIDYGTTYTGLAVALVRSDHAELTDIEVLQNWGKNGDNNMDKVRTQINMDKVRTQISYSGSTNGLTQWGAAISDQAFAIVNTKLELEPQSNRFDELELTWYLLRGVGNLAFDHLKKIGPDPDYPSVPPRRIVQDYLTHIHQSAFRPDVFKRVNLSQLVNTQTPVDIVVTVPAKWSHQATDATFKAVRGAGFSEKYFPTLRDTILISEPEAASLFAIRDLQSTVTTLQDGDCFILADAGGGTIDVVSYQVKQVKPRLQLERATEPDSRKCGSAFVDTAFKTWLRDDVLGAEYYGLLDEFNKQGRITTHATESGPIRELVKRFVFQKQLFTAETGDIYVDLPEPLNGLTIEGRVDQGQLLIRCQEMRDFFDASIFGAIELMDEQIQKLRSTKNRKARNVFLVGGFGASSYLQYHLQESLDLRKGSLKRPNSDKSLTAVVRGAVIHGIEKSLSKGVKYMSAVSESYAIYQNSRFEWLVRKGDLILSTEKRSIFSDTFCIPLKSCPTRKFDVTVYRYKRRADEDEDLPDSWEDGQHDVDKVGVVKCDVSAYLERDQHFLQNQQHRLSNLEIGPFRCHFMLSPSGLEVEVMHKKIVIASREIPHGADPVASRSQHQWS